MSIFNNKNILTKEQENKRTFTYTKGNVALTFTLNMDVKTELKDFAEILKVAREEVMNVLESKK